MIIMPPRRADDMPMKRIAAPGCRLPTRLPIGEILTDITQKDWKLGPRLGCGGFGDIYLASDDIHKSVGQDAKYVIKIEPHHNGPLFVEMNFYIRAARQHMINKWCETEKLSRIGVPRYLGSGSHLHKGERFRFLVIPRYGIDVGKLFKNYGRKLPIKLVNNLAVQMLDALEYIHSHGYAHSDVKGSNIVLEDSPTITDNPRAYLVDYGLAYRFRTTGGIHKPFLHDERRAHEGTLEFTSRDAHHGTHSRRGDMETLGYNILQWLCGRLPWEKEDGGMIPSSSPDDVHSQKELFLSDIEHFMGVCFPDKKKSPVAITLYMKYIATLDFEAKPNYTYLRNLFKRGGKSNKTNPINVTTLGKRISDENICYLRPKKMPYLRDRRPCRPVNCEGRITRNYQAHDEMEKFSWEEVLARHPDKLAKISAQPICDRIIPFTPPPSPPPPSLPTYAMLNVLQRMKDRQAGIYRQKFKSNEELKAKWMTPAMEKVAQLKKKVQSQEISMPKMNISPRLTRSRVARLNRK